MKKWHEFHCREEDHQQWKPRNDIVSQVRLTLMSMDELLKKVRYSNLFDLNHIMDAIDSINDEKRSALNNNDDTATTNSKDLLLMSMKKHRGRLSKRQD